MYIALWRQGCTTLLYNLDMYDRVNPLCIVTFCLIEVRAMVVAVQQPFAECTAIVTVRIVEHHPPPCAIHNSCTDQQRNGFRLGLLYSHYHGPYFYETKDFDTEKIGMPSLRKDDALIPEGNPNFYRSS